MQRKLAEDKLPENLDAICPNCRSLLDRQSLKCHACGAIFGLATSEWKPMAIEKNSSASLQIADQQLQEAEFQHPSLMLKFTRFLLWIAHSCTAISILLLLAGKTIPDTVDFIGFAFILYVFYYVMKPKNQAKKD